MHEPAYIKHRERTARRQRTLATVGRDIGAIPPVRDHDRRVAGMRSLADFLTLYMGETFALAWSDAHLAAIERLETSARRGGLFAFAMPRGFGKTSLSWGTACWALLTGLRPFVQLIGADEPGAGQLLDAIKVQLQHNDLLLDDYPEVCYPLRCLEGISQRAHGQLYRGRSTALQWTANSIVLPNIPGSRAAGSTVRVAGITGRIRGAAHTTPDGRTIRPSYVILDDPQTDESARSPSQCATRAGIVNSAILNLAGPGVPIAVAMPCTVIQAGDLADRFLDHDLAPEWHGHRTKAVKTWPTAEELWQQYARLWTEDLKAGGDGRPAADFYAANREAMDAGAVVTWPECHPPEVLSALQYNFNLRLRDPASYASEYDNEPLQAQGGADAISAKSLLTRAGSYAPNTIPDHTPAASRVCAFIDVHDTLLYWTLLAAADNYAALWPIDWGTWPEQRTEYYTLADARRTLAKKYPGTGKDGAIVAGLRDLLDALLARQWDAGHGERLRLDFGLVDSGYKPDAVDLAIKTCASPAAWMPSKGLPIPATNKPLREYQKRPGDKVGHYFRTTFTTGDRRRRQLQFDANYWKSAAARLLNTAEGDPGAVYFPKRDLRLLVDHWTAEFSIRDEARGRVVDVWKQRPNRDNHFFDCLIGCLVAHCARGAKLPGLEAAQPARRRRSVKYL